MTDQFSSWGEKALSGVERLRQSNHDLRGRMGALLFLLRGAYYTEQSKYRRYAEEDLRALWRGGVHDHIGGGFFSYSGDAEWLRPSFEKRLDDNARLALLYTEAWESGHMAFYRDAAESTLDWILAELAAPSGLYMAGQFSEKGFTADNPYLWTPEKLAGQLGQESGRHFAECYDISDEPNCGEASIPNLILNDRWHLAGEKYDDDRERLRLARQGFAGIETDGRTPADWNALLLAALARAARAFTDERYLAAAHALARPLDGIDQESLAPQALAAFLFAKTELYCADFDPAHLLSAIALGERLERVLDAASMTPGEECDRAWALAAQGFDALWCLTADRKWIEARGKCLRELCLHADRHGPDSLDGLCALLSASHTARALLCVSPDEAVPPALAPFRARYAPDLKILLKTPENAAALALAAPWSEPFTCGTEPRFYPALDGKWGSGTGL